MESGHTQRASVTCLLCGEQKKEIELRSVAHLCRVLLQYASSLLVSLWGLKTTVCFLGRNQLSLLESSLVSQEGSWVHGAGIHLSPRFSELMPLDPCRLQERQSQKGLSFQLPRFNCLSVRKQARPNPGRTTPCSKGMGLDSLASTSTTPCAFPIEHLC